ncbi:hypothetical protein U9M48_013950 [Paspalum notatum var. saurae]|uniref:Transposase n=1 Tax=Paspalum notatum var. saurae TaxID=547442 RepID=A0AAQ3T0K6_PASNO
MLSDAEAAVGSQQPSSLLSDAEAAVGSQQPSLLSDADAAPPSYEPAFAQVDRDNLQIAQSQDEEGRTAMISEDQICMLLGLRDEDERAVSGPEGPVRPQINMNAGDTVGAAIPVMDELPEEIVIGYDKDNPIIELGTVYPTMKDFRMALKDYAIKNEFGLGTETSNQKRFRGFCKYGTDCTWRICANRQDDNRTIKVTLLCKDHDCVSTRRMETTTPSKNWVASKAENILRLKPRMGAKELQEKLQEQWKAEVLKRMPGSVVEIDTMVVDGQVYFHRFFCALKPCIDGFREGCRPYLSIDSTALNGRWNGHLAAAVAVDGHTWMYPVAYGFIASETEDNWTWFMTHLRNAIGDPPLLAVCTDACKGLENAVASVFSQAEQRECFFHLMKNFKNRFQGFGRIYLAARAYREEVFTEHMAAIFNESGEIWKWFTDNHKLLWYRCHFNLEIKCDFITNNLAEVFNNWIRDIKDLPVAELADKIREMIMVLWSKRRRIAERLPLGRILPAVMIQLRTNTRGLGHLKVVYESMTDKSQWPEVYLPFRVSAPLARRGVGMLGINWPKQLTNQHGRQRKLWIKGCLEGGSKKKGANTNGEENAAPKSSAPTNAKGKKMIRRPMTCKRCGEKGHRQASYKCPLNGTKKKVRKPRVNKTKARKGLLNTPPRPTRDQILQDSPGRITRSKLAFLFGESTSAEPSTSAAPNLSTPTKEGSGGQTKKMTPNKTKKMTPRKKQKTM